ncbi:MAG: hypothetical protein GXO36_04010 [Chloroflexi bacterium]|nr:hypothetical protein [Chloroflexota bacterium]
MSRWSSRKLLERLAALLAFLIGAMAVFAGSKVVIFHIPVDYHVIPWLPVYNLTMGIVTVVFVAVALWRYGARAKRWALAVLLAHTTVLLLLLTVYRNEVANESLKAMSVRVTTWLIILGLLTLAERTESSPSGV